MSRASLDSLLRARPPTTPRTATELAHAIKLTDAEVGSELVIISVHEASAHELAREGLLPGSRVEVINRIPLGGPLIVSVGRVQLALGSSAAAAVRVMPLSGGPTVQPVPAHD